MVWSPDLVVNLDVNLDVDLGGDSLDVDMVCSDTHHYMTGLLKLFLIANNNNNNTTFI